MISDQAVEGQQVGVELEQLETAPMKTLRKSRLLLCKTCRLNRVAQASNSVSDGCTDGVGVSGSSFQPHGFDFS